MIVKNRFVKLFFPDRCPYCNTVIESGKIACDTCRKVFPEESWLNYAKGGYPCFSPFFYKGIFSTAVKRLKFSGKISYAPKLAVKICEAVINLNNGQRYDVVTCVPMHTKKRKKRHYNQSELLARECALLLGAPYEDLLEKVRENLEQHKCASIAERRDNVKGAYKVIDPEKVRGRKILIIDDILTTGYTLGECCKVLQKKHPALIHCATLCAKNDQ